MAVHDVLFSIDISLLLVPISILVMVRAVRNVFLSPLSAIPGPWYAAASDIWLTLQAARFLQCNTLHQLFLRYGPIVRVGPNRVVFCDRDAMKSVYCVYKLHKSSFYKALIADGHDHSMTSVTEDEHNLRRRAFASHYSLSHVSRFQPDINECVLKLVEALESATPHSVDCIHLLRHLLVDIIRATVLGLKPLAVDKWAARTTDPVCEAVRDFPMRAIVRTAIPPVLWKALAHLPLARWRRFHDSDHILAAFIRERLHELQRAGNTESFITNDEPTPLMVRMLTQRAFGSKDALSEQDIVSECMSHLVAGVDTSSSTFGFMLWELSRRPDVVQKLRVELSEVIPDRRTMPDYATLFKQTYLTAFLNEGFRMYGAVSSLLERVVPPVDGTQRSLSESSFDIMGFALPPGTIVGTQAWSMHRDPDVFPNPEFFDPERWLPASQDSPDRLARMGQYLMPFGAGTRACPGRYQAQIVFRVTITALVLNFNLSADRTETNEETMAPRDAFAVRPAARECRLTFTPRPSSA